MPCPRRPESECAGLQRLVHYLLGVCVGNIAPLLSVGYAFKVRPGGLTQAWAHLAIWLETGPGVSSIS